MQESVKVVETKLVKFLLLSRECKGAYPHSVAYETPAGCYAVDMLVAVLLAMEQIVSNPFMNG